MSEPYTQELFNLMYRINRDVNDKVQYVTDMDNYGLKEYWAVAGKKGDCEDEALKKLKLLRDAGIAKENLNIAICKMSGEGHAVLVLDSTGGDYVMDINSNVPILWYHYYVEWIMISQKGDFTKWRTINA